MWYKHSVVNAEGPRVPNPNAGEYLVSKKVSRTLSGFVSLVIKIPYSAAKNGMSFPVNPVFFYLKQLEYRLTAPTISYKIVDTFTFLTPYFVTAIPFCPPSLSVQPPFPYGKAMLCHNCCDLGEQTSNIEGGSGVFSTFFFAIKTVVLVGALIVLRKDNVSTNYVADCRSAFSEGYAITSPKRKFVFWRAQNNSLKFLPFGGRGVVGKTIT